MEKRWRHFCNQKTPLSPDRIIHQHILFSYYFEYLLFSRPWAGHWGNDLAPVLWGRYMCIFLCACVCMCVLSLMGKENKISFFFSRERTVSGHRRKGSGLKVDQTWIHLLALPLTCCVRPGKSFAFSDLQVLLHTAVGLDPTQWTSNLNISWELVRNAESKAPLQNYWIRICLLTRSSGELHASSSWISIILKNDSCSSTLMFCASFPIYYDTLYFPSWLMLNVKSFRWKGSRYVLQ